MLDSPTTNRTIYHRYVIRLPAVNQKHSVSGEFQNIGPVAGLQVDVQQSINSG